MRQNNILRLCTAVASVFALCLPSPVMAQEDGPVTDPDVIGFDVLKKNNVNVTQEDDGSWFYYSQGADPFVSTTGLNRDLTDDEVTITFEYKANQEFGFELFFSRPAGPQVYEGGYSSHFGTAPAAAQWTRVYLDISECRQLWDWGHAGQTFRFDAGVDAGLELFIRDFRIIERQDYAADFTRNEDGVIQLNSQEDFDKWVAANAAFGALDGIGMYDVDLNADVVASSTKGCIVQNMLGDFNGNWHTITMDIHVTAGDNGLALFGDVYGTVKNLRIIGEVEGVQKFLGGVAGDLNTGAVVENVHCSVNIISHISGDGTHGGIAGRCEGAATLRNILFDGKISNPEGATHSCGGITGWNNAKSTYEGILMIGDISEVLSEGSNTIGRNQGNVIIKNVFAVGTEFETPADVVSINPEDFADGSICFALNGDQRNISWFQTLGVDDMPVLGPNDGSHKQVFGVGELRCDGVPLGELTYNNEGGSSAPDHNYEGGTCTECGAAQPGFLAEVDGWYEITTPEHLSFISAFACTHNNIKIKLANDIDMTDMPYTPITSFTGTIDGQGHTISGLTVIVEPVGEDVATANNVALVGTANGATIKNLTLAADCYFEGNAYCGGFVGQTTGGTLTLENLIMLGTVKGTGANIAGLYGCNMSSAATVKITNCGVAGPVYGGNESGLISGWLGGNLATVTNVWAISDVVGYEGESTKFCRPGSDVSLNNCYSVFGNRSEVTIISEDAATNGELTWLLNGKSFVNPTWFQNIEDGDPCPSLDKSRGVVYPTTDGYASFDPTNAESFAQFKTGFIAVAQEYLESEDVQTYAGVALVEEYQTCIDAYMDASNLEEFVVAFNAEQAKKGEINTSITAYKNYEAAIAEIITTLEERQDFAGEARDFLESEYIDGGLEPGADNRAPNGSSDYILDNRLLTAAQVAKEIELARELLRLAVAGGYEPGTEITNMLVNGNFTDGLNGWKGVLFYGSGVDTREGFNQGAAEIWGSGSYDMYQEITVAKSGIYELQVNGGYRPFDQQNSIQYYPYIYLNDNANYLQAIIEDYMPVEDAVDQVNCNLDANQISDRPITNEEGDTIGWALHGVHSCNVAFSVGRYENRILVYVNEGEVLKVGACHPASGFGGNEWVGIGNIHLTYVGELAEAGESLKRVLESQLARAATLLQIEHRSDAEYMKYPNYSQALKDKVTATMEAATAAMDANDAEGMYAAITELSSAYKEIIECKKAYQSFFTKVEDVYSAAFTAAEMDPNCADMGAQAQIINDEAIMAYEEGTLSTEEAWACDIVKPLDVYPTIDEKGVYHISNTAHYCNFVTNANANITADNGVKMHGVLEGDVYVNNTNVIQNFGGSLDGQGHTMYVALEGTADGCAPFINLRGATIKNLVVEGNINTSYKFAAAIAAHAFENSVIDRINSKINISATISGDGTHGGILSVSDGGVTTISNCIFAGSLSGSTCNSNGGIVGWAGTGVKAIGCLVVANITADSGSANIIGRNGPNTSNCVFVTPYGDAPTGATQMTPEQLASGEAALLLNGDSTHPNVAWRQNLGDDLIPTIDATHKIVYKTAEGVFTNEVQNEIEKHTGDKGDPYVISTAQDMALLRKFLVPGRVNYISLAADIDMSEITNWVPLNANSDQANGLQYQNIVDFEGNGHVIKNFSAVDPDGSYNSFFGVLCGNVRNTGWENATVNSATTGAGILGGYIGHDQFVDASYTKQMSTIANVWITGKLIVGNFYAGAVGGNIGGPTTLKNVYTNVVIESTGETNNLGGLVGRVRDQLIIDGAYAAGAINAPSTKIGGITGGGFVDATTPGRYNNVVVWNNTDANFGPTKAAVNMTIPEADLFDLAIGEDGTLSDKSAMQNKIQIYGDVNVAYNEKFGTYSYFTKANGDAGQNYLRVDYSENEALKAALTDGYTIEVTFAIKSDNMNGRKPFSATESGGFNIETTGSGQLQAPVNTSDNGSLGYRTTTSNAKVVKDEYYHAVGVYEADNKISIYVNGANKAETAAPGVLHFPDNAGSQWIGVGADPGNTAEVSQSAADFEIVNARIYDTPMNEQQVKALYAKLVGGQDFFAGDQLSNISFFNGNNFAELQQTVVGWGSPWKCGMADGEYPTFDGTLDDAINDVKIATKGTIFNINGIQVEKTTRGLYIIDGKKVMVK